MLLDIGQTHASLGMLNRPGDGLAQGLTSDGATGLANGHQACVSPIDGTVVLQLTHQSGVHQDDELHMPCLAISVPELTLAHAQVLLPVSVKGLCSGPSSSVNLQHTMRFPMGAVGDKYFARHCCISF